MWLIENLGGPAGQRGLVLLAGIVLSAAALIAASPPPTRGTHASGIEILPPIAYDAPPLPDAARQAAREARTLMHENPKAFGWPFIDRTTGELVLSVASPSAATLARSWAPRDPAAARVPRRTRTVAYSMAALERIADDLTTVIRQRGMPDIALIHQWGPDTESNKIAIVIEHLSDPLLFALAARYDTRTIAIRVG